jgi:type VI secretion system secreted protein VgrG
MPEYKQAQRTLSVTTPLGPDVLLLVGFRGRDAVSELFEYELDLLAENSADVAFDKLLGQKVTVTFRWGRENDKKTYLNGMCIRLSQAERDSTFTRYRMGLVPQCWLLTRKAQSRIFQRLSVPDILKKVLTGFDVSYEIQGSFLPRDFCVQYRETDFNFACRLMEEEGIYYFFKHSDGNHTMVVANTPQGHADMPVQNSVRYEQAFGGSRDELRVVAWEKAQVLRSGKVTLWDHCFELPHKHLEAEKTIQESAAAGSVTHKLKVGGNDKLEIYDFPGEYAQRFDGVDKGGGDQASELEKIFQDNKRTVEIRMQQEALPSLVIEGESNCRQFVSGHKFSLEKHFNADGSYVMTSVEHRMTLTAADYRSGEGIAKYRNAFTCIPAALPYRPPRTTPKPVVQGTQTAVVVGPSGEEIFTDKYSRVKVQFHWDRQGKNDTDSSCWVRVATLWAGKQWGMIHIPRIGQEVVVDFLEGDPDQPIIVGSVYNADMMPPYALPANKTQSGVKSRSSLHGGPSNFNEIRFEDKKSSELLTIHAERNQEISVEADESHSVGHDRSKTIGHDETTKVTHDRTETVGNDETITIGVNRTETVGSNEVVTIGSSRVHTIGAADVLTVGAARTVTVGAGEVVTIGGALAVSVGGEASVTVGEKATVTVGAASVMMNKDGTIEVKGKEIKVTGTQSVKVSAPKVEIHGDASVDIDSGGPVTIKGNPIKLNC